jgi:hypothetical protein
VDVPGRGPIVDAFPGEGGHALLKRGEVVTANKKDRPKAVSLQL